MAGFANGVFGARRALTIGISPDTLGNFATCIDILGPAAIGELAKEAVDSGRKSDEKNALYALLVAGLYSRCANLGKVPQWEQPQ
ncbi:MAG: hypothetical protein DMG15_03765 [Acidobacteria bacterium]|nr:MAG: hypothetical protein DMG15_03765 [Acidobacteriota bacterium]